MGRARGGARREVRGSGNERWRAGLGLRAGPGAEQVRGAIEPDHALWLPIGRRDRGLRRVNRRAGMGNAAEGTAAVMRACLTGLFVLAGVRNPAVVADRGRLQWIGGGDAGRPASRD